MNDEDMRYFPRDVSFVTFEILRFMRFNPVEFGYNFILEIKQ